MWVWIDSNDEDIRVSTFKKRLIDDIRKDYDIGETPLIFEIRGDCIAVLTKDNDMELGIIIKAKVIK